MYLSSDNYSHDLILQPEEQFDFENRDFDNLDPKDYGIKFDEEEMFYGMFNIIFDDNLLQLCILAVIMIIFY